MQSFRCPACGNFNALGEPFCTNCGQRFAYNCPVCGNPVNKLYLHCPNCGTVFNWTAQYQQPAVPSAPDNRQAGATMIDSSTPNFIYMHAKMPVKLTHRPIFWIILTIVCAVLIASLFVIDILINK